MIDYFSHGFLPEKLLLWCLVMILISKFQLWCTQKGDSHWSWSGLRTYFTGFSPQDISICTFSYPLDIKWGTLVSHPKTAVAPWWAHGGGTVPFLRAFLAGSSQATDLWLVGFSSFSCFAQNQWIPPHQEPGVQGAEPAVHLRPLLFECSCSQRRHPKPHPGQSCWAWILSSLF